MARIEELPDDYDESQPLPQPPPPNGTTTNPSPSSKPPSMAPIIDETMPTASGETPFGIKEGGLKTDAPMMPEMPPAMASVKSHSADEILEMMNKMPLFMTDVDKAQEGNNKLACFNF